MKLPGQRQPWRKATTLNELTNNISSLDAGYFCNSKKNAEILIKSAQLVTDGQAASDDVEVFYNIFQYKIGINSNEENKNALLNNGKNKNAISIIANGQYDTQEKLDAAITFNRQLISALHENGVGYENGEMLHLFKDNFSKAFNNGFNKETIGQQMLNDIKNLSVQQKSHHDSDRLKWQGMENVAGTSLRILPPPTGSAAERIIQNKSFSNSR